MDIREQIAPILLQVFNEGFVMGEIGVGDDQQSADSALDQILAIKVEEDGVCGFCLGSGKYGAKYRMSTPLDTPREFKCRTCNETGTISGRTLKQVLEAQND